ncbi:MAG: glycosyltransferase family 4 protein [Lewinellaceae bacterium]|nr:glycosyltransferase family 4 protein [Lewinellaceae bacterium]
MKILLCTPTFQQVTHGPAKFAQFLLRTDHLFPGNEVRILTEGIEKPVEGKIYKITLDYPRPVHALGKFLRMWSYYRAALKIRNEYAYDVLVFNDAILGMLSGWLMPKEVKVVGMLNSDEYLGTSFSGFYWSRKWLIRLLHKPAEALATWSADQTIACSEYLKEKILSVYGTSPTKAFSMYQAVDIQEGNIQKREMKPGRFLKILHVKSDYRVGGLQYLIQALAMLAPLSFELIIIGPLSEWRPQIEKLYLPANNIKYTFLGNQSQEQVFRQMQASDILCIPSLREGLGVANIEGLNYGIPVVSTNVGGIPEVLGDGAYGWLAEPGNPESLARAIKECIDNPELRWEKSLAGRRQVEEKFGYRKMLECFLQILEEA